MRPPHSSAMRRGLATIAVAATATAIAIAGQLPASATEQPAAPAASAAKAADHTTPAPKLTNLAHLDWLLDSVPLPANVAGHTTYKQASEPTATAPWVYANRNADGTFTHVGGGPITDATKGYYAQGSFDADDISRAAVVYLRDWAQNHTPSSRQHAYELLRELTYLQTSTGPNAGNVVLWQQHDGTLNPSAIPVDLPNPSDSAESFWLARTVWALGEGYAGFKTADPAFAQFLQQRMTLALGSLDRQSLAKYGTTEIANGVKVPGWLIVDSASATSEAVLGLSAYVNAAPGDRTAATALARYADGINRMASGGVGKVAVRRDPARRELTDVLARLGRDGTGRALEGRNRSASQRLPADRGRRHGPVHGTTARDRRTGQRLDPHPRRPDPDRVRRRLPD